MSTIQMTKIDLQVFDPEEALQRIGGDEPLLREMIGIFNGILNDDMASLEKSVLSKDGEMIRRNAHRIKGSVGNFGINRAYRAAHALEMGHSLPEEQIAALHSELKNEIYELSRALTIFSLG